MIGVMALLGTTELRNRIAALERGGIAALARHLGVPDNVVSKIKSGTRNISADEAVAIADFLDTWKPGFAESPVERGQRIFDMLPPHGQQPARRPAAGEPQIKIGTDGHLVQIMATVDGDGLDDLIRRLQALKAVIAP